MLFLLPIFSSPLDCKTFALNHIWKVKRNVSPTIRRRTTPHTVTSRFLLSTTKTKTPRQTLLSTPSLGLENDRYFKHDRFVYFVEYKHAPIITIFVCSNISRLASRYYWHEKVKDFLFVFTDIYMREKIWKRCIFVIFL